MKKKMKNLFKKHKRYIWLAIVLLATWSFFWIAYQSWFIPKAGTAVSVSAFERNSDLDYWIQPKNDTIETSQVINVSSDQLIGLGIVLQSKVQINNLPVNMSVYDAQTGECFLEESAKIDVTKGDQYIKLMFEEKLTKVKGRWFRVNLKLSGNRLSKVRLLGTKDKKYSNYETLIDGKIVKETILVEQFVSLSHFLIPLFKGFVLLLTAFIILFFFFVFTRKWVIERLYLFTVLYLGILYSLIIIPFAAPDEGMHANTIYRITNEILNVPDTRADNTIYKRASDANINLNAQCDRNQYYEVYSHFFDKSEDNDLVEVAINDTGVLPVMYGPAILGFLIARLSGMGPILMYMISRWLMLLFFAIVTYIAMKLMPFGKIALFVICIMPISLQQASSLSYDAIAIPVIILFVALCFNIAFCEKRLNKKHMILFVILGILLSMVKGGAYLPLVLLLLMIPAEKFGGRKRKWMSFIGYLCILGLLFIIINLAYVKRAVGETSVDEVELYTLGYLLTHPTSIFYVLNLTFLNRSAEYISTMIGNKLGYLNIYLNDLIVYGYIVVLGVSSISTEENKNVLNINQRIWSMLSMLGCIGLILLSMWIFITPLGNPMISGVQGRYFIPILWLFLMFIRNKNLVFKRNIDREITFSAVILEILSLVYLFQSLFA